MNLPSLSSSGRLRRLIVVTGIAALTALTGACGDDDDDDDGVSGQGGSGGAGGRAAGKGGCSGGQAGSGGKASCGGGGISGSGGTGGISGSGGAGGAIDEDAGLSEDAGQDPGPNPDNFRNVRFELTGLASGTSGEIGKFMQFRLISEAGDLITVGVIHGAPAAAFAFDLPHSAPMGEVVTVEVWADTFAGPGGDNAYDAAMDNAWTATISASAANPIVPIEGGTQPSPPTLNQGAAVGSLGFTMTGTSAHTGDLFELRVIDNDTGRLVGRQLLGVPGTQIGLEVFGVIHTGVEYQVDYAIDLDDDATYDAPPTDAAWRQFVTATATGYMGGPGATITLSAVPSSADYVDVGF